MTAPETATESTPAPPPALPPLAITHEAVLRRLAEHGAPDSLVALAEAAGVSAKNISRDLRLLQDAGLVAKPLGVLMTTPAADAALEAMALFRRRAAGQTDDSPAVITAGPAAAGVATPDDGAALLPHDDIAPDPLNPRTDFSEEGLIQLADSIAADGLLQPLLVRPAEVNPLREDGAPPIHRLVAGERRWQAIGRLIADGRWPADRPVPVTIRAMSNETHLRLALIENLQRRDLKPLEEARAYRRLRDEFALSTAQIAEQIGFTQRVVQQRLQLLDLSAEDQARLDAGRITLEDARKILATPKPTPPTLTPGEWLVAIEALAAGIARAEAEGESTDGTVHPLVQPTAKEDAALPALSTSAGPHLFGFVGERHDDDGFRTGVHYLTVWSWGRRPLALRFPDLDTPLGLAATLAQVRAEAGVTDDLPPGVYATAWLNGPFEASPETLAEIAREKAERADRIKARQEEVAQQEQRHAFAAELAAQIIDNHRQQAEPTQPALFASAMAGLDRALPWSVADDGTIRSATGATVITAPYHNPDAVVIARQQMIALAVNAAAGLTLPEAPPPDPDSDDGEAAEGDEDADGFDADEDGEDA